MDKIRFEAGLHDLGIPCELVKESNTAYYNYLFLIPSKGVTVAKIKARKNNISLLIGQPATVGIMGDCIAIRTENTAPKRCDFETFEPSIYRSKSPCIPVGKTEKSELLTVELSSLPHLLVCGATGSGKSVFLNNCIESLIMGGGCELVLFDFKRCEFSKYNDLKVSAYPVISDPQRAVLVLREAVEIMESRYRILEKSGCQNIDQFRKNGGKMHRICIIIDELSDLLIQNKKAVEPLIIRLCQLGRACGIHCILSTQRPSSDILTGLIKANIPSRISFKVSTKIDSKVILDRSGAETLKGCGDGLFLNSSGDLVRFQAPAPRK